jgi:SAM-dependent methyltransferase
MIESSYYNKQFYGSMQDGSLRSARMIVPLLNSLFKPKSVIDIGCGIGLWLKVWIEDIGLTDVMGLEGPYITKEMLCVPAENIMFVDLKEKINISKHFDLVTSFEVAEHLPETAANSFVKQLTSLGKVIAFSAAIPGQGGTYHINEQYPEYWAKKFAEHGYVPIDYMRPIIWNNTDIDWWYRQNILIYIQSDKLKEYDNLKASATNTNPDYLLRVHPLLWEHQQKHILKTKSLIGFLRWKLYPLKLMTKRIFTK